MKIFLIILMLSITIHADLCEDYIVMIKQDKKMAKLYSKKNSAIVHVEKHVKRMAQHSYEAKMYCRDADQLEKIEFDRQTALRMLKIIRKEKEKGYIYLK